MNLSDMGQVIGVFVCIANFSAHFKAALILFQVLLAKAAVMYSVFA